MSTNYPLSDVFYIYGLGSWLPTGGSSVTVDLAEALQISDTSAIEGSTYTDITSDETIQLAESLVAKTASYCAPVFGTGIWRIELQRRNYTSPGDGGASEWDDDWITVWAHDFDYNVDYMKDWWYPRALERAAPIRTEGGAMALSPRDIELFFGIEYRQLFCQQTFTTFLYDHAWGWKRTNGVNERRRILLYPNGESQVNRWDEVCKPIPVVFASSFREMLERHKEFKGRRGGYGGKLMFQSEYLYGEADDGTSPTEPVYASTDPFNLTSGDWQGVIPWGAPFG